MSVITGKPKPLLVPYYAVSATTFNVAVDLGIIKASPIANATWTLPALALLKKGGMLWIDNQTKYTISVVPNVADLINTVSSFIVNTNSFAMFYTGVQWNANSYAVPTLAANANTNAGIQALANVTSGVQNTAYGYQALQNDTTGYSNSAFGYQALQNCTVGLSNVAVGSSASPSLTTGTSNTCIGNSALINCTTGGNNISIGNTSGYNLTTGSNNIYLGATANTAAEAGIMRLGVPGSQTVTYLAGGTPVTNETAAAMTANILSAANIVGGIATNAANFTLDTGANIDAAFPSIPTGVFGQVIKCLVVNTSGTAITITTAAGITLSDAAGTVVAHDSRLLYFRRTAANTYTVY